MIRLIEILLIFFVVGCGDNIRFVAAPQENCTKTPEANGLTLVRCPDGASAVVRTSSLH